MQLPMEEKQNIYGGRKRAAALTNQTRLIYSLLSDKFLLFHLSTYKGAYHVNAAALFQVFSAIIDQQKQENLSPAVQ